MVLLANLLANHCFPFWTAWTRQRHSHMSLDFLRLPIPASIFRMPIHGVAASSLTPVYESQQASSNERLLGPGTLPAFLGM